MGVSHITVAHQPVQANTGISSRDLGRSRDIPSAQEGLILPESVLHSMLRLERLRGERSGKAFVLMLLGAQLEDRAAAKILQKVADSAMLTKRETDLLGWYKENTVLGLIFIEVSLNGNRSIVETLRGRIDKALIKHLGRKNASMIGVSLNLSVGSGEKHDSICLLDVELNRKEDQKGLPDNVPAIALNGNLK